VARDSLTANALATTLCVLKPSEGLSLLRMIEGAEGLIIAADGTPFRTPGFSALEVPLVQISPMTDSTTNATSSTSPPVTAGTAAATAAEANPLVPGQTVTIISNDEVSFVKGTAQMKRPVQPEETFKVVSVNGEDVTVADLFGYQATLDRSQIKTTDTPSASAPAAATATATNAAPTSATNGVAAPTQVSVGKPWPATYQVAFGIELPAPPTGGRPKRPYLALWVEDASGKPIRTITVWGDEGKYLHHLSNWWAFAQAQQNVISSTTRATRPPGKYQVVWDGLDDAGKPVGQGTYGFALEVAREHGSHQIQRVTLACGATSAQGTIPGAVEFLDCPITYGCATP
jgi:hypothetical protein